eukprot:460017_1
MMNLLNSILNETHNTKLINNKQSFLSYFKEHKMDGNTFTETPRKTFSNSICEFCNNMKLKAAAAKLYNLVKNSQDQVVDSEEKSSISVHGNNKFMTTVSADTKSSSIKQYYSFGIQYRYTDNLKLHPKYVAAKYKT